MAQVLLFHHAHGMTPGFLEFAEEIRAAGHTVHTPDLYAGQVFTDLDEGVAYAQSTGFAEIVERGRRAAEALPPVLVYAGFSLGTLPAQELAQTRPGARGALLFHGGEAPSAFGSPWPDGLPLQIHTSEDDKWVDHEAVRALAEAAAGAELFLYPGDRHLFAERGAAEYDEAGATLLRQRALAFLNRVG